MMIHLLDHVPEDLPVRDTDDSTHLLEGKSVTAEAQVDRMSQKEPNYRLFHLHEEPTLVKELSPKQHDRSKRYPEFLHCVCSRLTPYETERIAFSSDVCTKNDSNIKDAGFKNVFANSIVLLFFYHTPHNLRHYKAVQAIW
ncbi:X-linked retinitis pigmentosa GTPase regulator-interacting protein 1-like [Mesocricetus auratus]|uniref:X-linked retinitis pigmentosa GTPase regulator-interacting protein 1-like n=1 Tax=Mesocricetus auratus TaxID=10036 RepID=A0ABM2WUP9_MESAU|nr:X-linked retinitis pigmentosa GTPase regulator-interacting protein 1-like [Mesocricetus auratus]